MAHEAVSEAYRARLRDSDPVRYNALLADFHAKLALALPSCGPDFLAGLAAGHADIVETAIAFLEADPWFFRSGYEKQRLIRHLKRARLSDVQRDRLGRVVLAVIDGRDREGFRHYCRLACGVWSPMLDEEVAARMGSDDPGIRRRATWVAEAAISAGKA